MSTILVWLASATALGVTMQATAAMLRGAHSCATPQGPAEVSIPTWMGSWVAAPGGRSGSQMWDLHQCTVAEVAFAYRQLLQTSCEGGNRRLEISSFLSWEEAAKVSCPSSTLSVYPAGLAWWVVSVQTDVDTKWQQTGAGESRCFTSLA